MDCLRLGPGKELTMGKKLDSLAKELVDLWIDYVDEPRISDKGNLRAAVLDKLNSLSGSEAAYVAIMMYGEFNDKQATAFDRALVNEE